MTEQTTIMGLLSKMAADFCDNYCKWPEQYQAEDGEEDGKLYEERCVNCPLNILGI